MAVSSPAGWDRFNRLEVVPATLWEEEPPSWTYVGRGDAPRLMNAIRTDPERAAGLTRDLGSIRVEPLRAIRHLLGAVGLGSADLYAPRSLRVASSDNSRSGQTVTVQQQVDGHDIVGATLKVHFGRSGDFVIRGNALAELRTRTPRRSVRTNPADARAAASRAFEVAPSTVEAIELQSFPMPDGEARWAWRASIVVDEEVADVRAYFDAESLGLLLSYNIASALTGQARVFPRNPAETPAVSARLWDLGPDPSDQLRGARLDVVPGPPSRLTRQDRDFRLPTTDVGFSEPNAYFHLRNGLRAFTALKGRRRTFASPPFRPLQAVVRDRASRRNAYYLPTQGKLRFGDFDVGPSALSADVLYHELGHAVSDNASKLGRGLPGSQSRGLSEGYSDYFAHAALGNPWMCEWVEPTRARNCEDPALRFPPGFIGEEHALGGVWAAVLWGIRLAVPARDADQIAFDSLYLVGPDSSFMDARNALLTVGSELSASGKISADHSWAIEREWDRRA